MPLTLLTLGWKESEQATAATAETASKRWIRFIASSGTVGSPISHFLPTK